MKSLKQFDLIKKRDSRGELFFLNLKKKIRFTIRRVYYIFNNNSTKPRGFHAHKKLKQLLICLKGSCTVILDDGHKKKKIFLNKNSRALLIDNKIWHEIYYREKNTILFVLASEIYKEFDYIRNYNLFLKKFKK